MTTREYHVTDAEARAILDGTYDPTPEELATDTVASWQHEGHAIAWGARQERRDGSGPIFRHLAHASNAYAKAGREYAASLPPTERPSDSDGPEVAEAHELILHHYWYEQVQARRRGEVLRLEAHAI